MLRNLCLYAMLALTGANSAIACSSTEPPPNTEQRFAEASAVFVARIVRTDEAKLVYGGETHAIVEGTFRPIEVLKGQPPADGKVRSLVYGPGNCTIPLLAGWDYVFFLVPGDGHNFVGWPNGSFGTFNIEGTEPKRILEELRKLSKARK
jgi:hypothetical protein